MMYTQEFIGKVEYSDALYCYYYITTDLTEEELYEALDEDVGEDLPEYLYARYDLTEKVEGHYYLEITYLKEI